jgi:hypothetical protein
MNHHDQTCGDVHPGHVACDSASGQDGWCAEGDLELGHGDLVVLRRLVLGAWRASCGQCAGQSPSTGPSDLRRPGDVAPSVGGDGLVNVADVVLALRWAVGLASPEPEERLRVDVAPARVETGLTVIAGDGAVNVADVVLLLRTAVGLTRLAWPVREIVLRVQDAGSFVGFGARVEGWPAWAEPAGVVTAGCGARDASDMEVTGATWAFTCVTDPVELTAPLDLARVLYRSPEAVPAGSLTAQAELADRQLSAGTVRPSLSAGP